MKYPPKHLNKPYRGKKPLTTKTLIGISFVCLLICILIVIKYNAPGKKVSVAEPSAKLITLSEDVPVVETSTVTPEAKVATPREVVQMDYTVKPGVLYTYDDVVAWGVQLKNYSSYKDLTKEEQNTINEGQKICHLLLTLSTYEVCSNETLPQMLAKIVTREIGGLTDNTSYSTANMEKAAVVWCILNRVDKDYSNKLDAKLTCGCIVSAAKAANQYAYSYGSGTFDGTVELSTDVLIRWVLEKYGYDYGRVLPAAYLYFTGDGKHNNFRTEYSCSNTMYWDWSYTDPYKK
jgi:hypothetical protein